LLKFSANRYKWNISDARVSPLTVVKAFDVLRYFRVRIGAGGVALIKNRRQNSSSGTFSNDEALSMLCYLALNNIS